MKNYKRIVAIVMAVILTISAVSYGRGVNATSEVKDGKTTETSSEKAGEESYTPGP